MFLSLALASLLITQGQPDAATPRWENGPPTDPGYFPIAVWLQDPRNAARYKEAGVNLYVALWRGPNEAQLAALKKAGMPVICNQNAFGLAHKDDKTIVGWMHGDEPDNAQMVTDPKTGKRGYGGPIPPPRIVADYHKLRAADPTRPIMLNLGQGVANDQWKGRGNGAKFDDYLTYVKGGDIISFDVYPVAGINKPDGENYLWYVPKGIDRLVKWSEGKRIIWNCIEASRISDVKAKVSPHQIKAEVWMSLIHGSTGLIYFVHQFEPKFNEHALLDDPELLPAVTAINRQIHELAPVLNSPTLPKAVMVQSSDDQVPIDAMAKRSGGVLHVFAAGMRNAPARATFTLADADADADAPAGIEAEVIGEGRRIPVKDGKFTDEFGPHDVHLYRIVTSKAAAGAGN